MKITDKIFKFFGGIKPDGHKQISTRNPIKKIKIPENLIIPIRQHVGKIPNIVVKVGDKVLKGQVIAEPVANISAATHASTSGTVTSIKKANIPHPSGLPDLCITIKSDGKDLWIPSKKIDFDKLPLPKLLEKIKTSGVVGLGGATFPSHIKLNASKIKTLIINAAECEPYITCDDMGMREKTCDFLDGIQIIMKILKIPSAIIGIEDNKPEAIKTLKKALSNEKTIQLKIIPTVYPSGDEKRLIYLMLGKKIPKEKRPTEFGIQVFNVATLTSISRYIRHGEPVISRIVTVTGALKNPNNYEALIGTPIKKLIQDAGGDLNQKIIMGGPMMGFELPNIDVGVTKAMNCLLAMTDEMTTKQTNEAPCIRCSKCVEVCPAQLQPQELFWHSKSKQFEKLTDDFKLFDCIECGCCSYVCPSNIPLVQYYRFAKSEIRDQVKSLDVADIARERNEFRIFRLEREKKERAERNAQRRAQANTENNQKLIEEKKAAIAEALKKSKENL
jgi:electron transport complex protein RnfC